MNIQGICLVLLMTCTCLAFTQQQQISNELTKSRQKRWIPRFPYNSCYALAVVLALPLELKGRNVFFSYNFETNYYFPYFDNVQGIVPIPFATIDQADTNLGTIITNAIPADTVRSLNEAIPLPSSNSSELNSSLESIIGTTENTTAKDESHNEEEASPVVRRKSRAILEHLMTRARFYKMLESKMNSAGMHGRKCLQKAICDASSSPVGEHNGLIGDIVHIIFTPSTSKDENLPRDLTDAELRGKSNKCAVYAKLCPSSVLDIISTYI